METLKLRKISIDTYRDLGARHITLVAPYLCYMRQDKAFHPGEALSQRVIGTLLSRRWIDALVTVDSHLRRAGITHIWSMDAIPHSSNVLHLDRLLAEAPNGCTAPPNK